MDTTEHQRARPGITGIAHHTLEEARAYLRAFALAVPSAWDALSLHFLVAGSCPPCSGLSVNVSS